MKHKHECKRSHTHFGAKSIDEYASRSCIGKWNSGLKMFFAFVIMIISISSGNYAVPVFIAVSMGAFTVFGGKMRVSEYFSMLAIPVGFMFMSGLAIAVDIKFSGEFSITLPPENIQRALHITIKALGAISAMYMMSLSTQVSEIIAVLAKLKLPAILTELMNLMYRYIFILADSQAKMKNSAASRMGWKNFRISIKTFGLIGGNIFTVSLHKANDYYNAIESRCGLDGIKFMVKKKPVKMAHLVVFIIYTTVIIMFEIICRIFSFGRLG